MISQARIFQNEIKSKDRGNPEVWKKYKVHSAICVYSPFGYYRLKLYFDDDSVLQEGKIIEP